MNVGILIRANRKHHILPFFDHGCEVILELKLFISANTDDFKARQFVIQTEFGDFS